MSYHLARYTQRDHRGQESLDTLDCDWKSQKHPGSRNVVPKVSSLTMKAEPEGTCRSSRVKHPPFAAATEMKIMKAGIRKNWTSTSYDCCFERICFASDRFGFNYCRLESWVHPWHSHVLQHSRFCCHFICKEKVSFVAFINIELF